MPHLSPILLPHSGLCALGGWLYLHQDTRLAVALQARTTLEQPPQTHATHMQQYAKAAKDLLDNVAKLTIRQDAAGQQPRPAAPILLQASSAPASTQGAARPTVPLEARVSRFKQELLASRINLDELRRLAFQGIPDKDGLRAMTWKVGGGGQGVGMGRGHE